MSADHLQTFTLHSQGQQLPQTLVVYRHGDRHLVPLQALSAAVGLEIRVDPASASASGWIGGENSNFLLDIEADEARRGFDRFDIDPDLPWGRDGADLYLDAELLQTVLPLGLSFNSQSSRLGVTSTYPLPVLDAIARERAHEASLGQQQNFHSGGLDPIHPHDYQDVSAPSVLGFVNSAVIGDDLLTQDYRLGVISNGDLAGQSYEFNYTKLAKERSEYRLRFSRDLGDISESLPFSLGQYQAGDISYFGDNLISGNREGLGFQIGHGKQDRFGVTTLEGNAPPDWQVHLYRNGVLLAFTQAKNSGRYQFTDVTLLEGTNVFELHLYGNNGEHHVRRQTVDNSRSLRQGQFSYNFMYLDNTRFAFNERSEEEVSELGAQRQVGIRANYGLTDFLDIGVSYQQQKLEQDDWGLVTYDPINFFGVQLGANIWGNRLQLEMVSDDDNNQAYFAGLSRRLGANHQFRLTHRHNDELQNDLTEQEEIPLRNESELWLEGQTWRLGGWQYAFGGAYREPEGYQDSYGAFENRLSTQWGPVHFTHNYYYDAQYDDRLERQSGQVLLTTSGNDWSLSSQWDYQFGQGVTEMETRMRWRPWYGIYNQTLLWYADPEDKKSRVGFGHEVAYRYRWLTVGLQGGIDTRGNWQVNTTATFAINHQDNRDQLDLAAVRPQQADVKVRVFVDGNNNGRFDRTDQPLAGVSIDTAPSWPREASDDLGEVMLRQVPAQTRYLIDVDSRMLPSGLVLRDGPVEIMPLAGQLNEVELALVRLSQIQGQLTTDQGVPLPELALTLTDLEKRPVTQLSSDSEGRFRFDAKPGNYYLAFNGRQLRSLGLSSTVPVYPINVGSDGKGRSNWTIELAAEVSSPFHPANASAQLGGSLVEQEAMEELARPEPSLPANVTRAAALPAVVPALARMSDSDYVLQLAASRDPFDLAALKRRYPGQSLFQITAMRGGKPMNLLLAGQYPSRRSAQLGARSLPASLSNGEPMVRRVADLKRESISPAKPNSAAVAPAAAATAPKPAEAAKASGLEALNDNQLVWQLAATRSESSAKAVLRQHKLSDNSYILFKDGWYQVLWGGFDNRQQAHQALEALDKAPQNPWLRPVRALR
ncbi:SPOR domain-containing protein [Ferrimonas marina]|uniref:SPOR domain-containing protein n=1 Tax=Ferrimonas marina TaxID=299255 RepID=UPI0011611C77|nr:SPOR domain-containing protein [Ferrimonas marina]